jgi:hypothetical protein
MLKPYRGNLHIELSARFERNQSQVANHTRPIQFNEIEGLERFG